MEKDRSQELVNKECEAVKNTTRLDSDSCRKVHDYSGHNSAPYGEGGPSAAGGNATGHAPGRG